MSIGGIKNCDKVDHARRSSITSNSQYWMLTHGIESAAYSKSEIKIHFDNSVKATIPLVSASYTTSSLLHKYGMRHWSDSVTRFMTEYWKNEYAECFDFETHEQVLRDRLINKNIPIKQIADKELIIKQFLGW